MYGNISPWILYVSNKSHYIFDRLDQSQIELIENTLNPVLWRIKIKENINAVRDLEKLLNENGF